VELVERGDLIAVASAVQLHEVSEALRRPKFSARLNELGITPGEVVEAILSIVELIPDPQPEPVVVDDPDDDHVIACAVAGEAAWLVSGDSHLLRLVVYRGIRIGSPKDFLDAYARRNR